MSLLSINETTTYRWSFEEDVLAYAAAGIPAVGVWRQKLSDFGYPKAVELLAECNMKVSHLFWAGGFTGSEGRSYRESIADASDALDTAHEIGAQNLVVYSGARAGHTHNHARRLIRDALLELAPKAAELGVILAIEPMHPGCAAAWTFLTSLDETLSLLCAVGTPQVKLVFDTYHLGHDPKVVDQIPAIASQVGLVQLGDARGVPEGEQSRCFLGEGRLPLRQIVRAFEAAGYQGYYDVELLGEEIADCDYPVLLRHAKTALAELLNNGK